MKRPAIAALVILMASCSEIIGIEDISDETVLLQSPVQGAEVTDSITTLSWSKTSSINSYLVQLTKPSFAESAKVILDSLITLDSTNTQGFIAIPLDSSAYEWRVKGLNDGYETNYSSAQFQVIFNTPTEPNFDISNAQITILAPTQSAVISSESLEFNWDAVNNAIAYQIQVAQPGFANATQIVLDSIIPIDSSSDPTKLSVTLSNSAYEWRLRAFNSTSEVYSDSIAFTVDVQEE